MAEGDKFEDEETGESLIEDSTGKFVNSVQALPGVVNQATGQVVAAVTGAESALMDNLLIPKGAFDVLGGAFDVLGFDETGAALADVGQTFKGVRDRVQPDFFKAQKAENPVAFALGQMGGSFLPGNAPVQGGIGALQGVGFGDTPGQQVAGGLLGGLGGIGGAIGARRANRSRNLRFMREGSAADRARANAIDTMDELGVPLTESDVAIPGSGGEARAQTRDRLRQLLFPGDSARAKRDAMNEVITDTILPGKASNAVTDQWMTTLLDTIDEQYAGVRSMLPKVTKQNEAGDVHILRMFDDTGDVRLDQKGRVVSRVDQVADSYETDTLTPERWSQLRSSIAGDARAARSTGEWETAEALYHVRQGLDDLVTAGNPETVAALNEANELFRYAKVLESPNVVSAVSLDINPGAFQRNMKKMFPRVWREGSKNPEDAKVMYSAMAAAQQFPEFRSSGTGEMNAAASGIMQRGQMRARQAVGQRSEAIGGAVGRRTGQKINDALGEIPDQIIDYFRETFGTDTADPEPE